MAYFRFETNLQNLYGDMIGHIEETGIWEDLSSNPAIARIFNSKGSTGADNINIVMAPNDYKSGSNTHKRMLISFASEYEPSDVLGEIGTFVNIYSRYAPSDINFLKYTDGYTAINYSVTPSVVANENTRMEVLLIVTQDYIQCCWWQKNMATASPLSNGFYVGLIDRLNPIDRRAIILMPFCAFTTAAGADHGSLLKTNNHGVVLMLEDFSKISANQAYLAINAPSLLHVGHTAAGDRIGYKGNGDNGGKLIMFDIAVTSPAVADKYGLRGYLNGIKTFGFHTGYKNGDIIVDDNGKKFMYFQVRQANDGNHYRTLIHCEDVYLFELR
jgi:hypothetical protein